MIFGLRTEYASTATGAIDPQIIAAEQRFPGGDHDSRARRPAALPQPQRRRRRSRSARLSRGARRYPRLYEAQVRSAGETLSLRLGFRRVEIDRDILRINGSQVIFRGMNRHETHPIRGRMFDEAVRPR